MASDPAPVLDYPTAWAIQHEVGDQLDHHERCSSVPGWSAISGPGLLCDCGAIVREWERRAVSTGEDPTTAP